MKIKNIEHELAESLANLPTLDLPPALRGLRHLPLVDRHPQVSIRRADGRKVRGDADSSYFGSECTVQIEFVEAASAVDPEGDGPAVKLDEISADPDSAHALRALIEELWRTEARLPFVGLKWFRDKVLPESSHEFAGDPEGIRRLLNRAIDQSLILTNQVPNPNEPSRPVTAIRVNRTHPQLQPPAPERRERFHPIPIRGGSIAETVLADRR